MDQLWPRERAERFSMRRDGHLPEIAVLRDDLRPIGVLAQISTSGALLECQGRPLLEAGERVACLTLRVGGQELAWGGARVARVFVRGARTELALAFDEPCAELVHSLRAWLVPAPYVHSELCAERAGERPRRTRASDHYIDRFYARPSRDLFTKCTAFRDWVDDMQHRGLYQRLFRVTVTSNISSRVTVFDPLRRSERSLLCFDSNSYLCLHDHPRVVARVREVVGQVGYGTPSAQLLGGTHRYLRELEAELSAFHGREDTIVFPTGFAANAGAVGALVRAGDAVLRDRLAHASIHEACRASAARSKRVFRHNDVGSLDEQLAAADAEGCEGKLVVTDGVFSMHGRIAPLPELVATVRRHQARLMVDDAHGVGVIGPSGRGVEEHFGMEGSVDVLMGTLSKTIGALGGYVSGSRELVDYLRFFAPSSMFTTAPPAALCAGMVEALRVIVEEPEHHTALWRNIRHFVPALRAAGFIVPDPESAIVTLFLGADGLAFQFNRELFERGVKCSSVAYPAVPKNESILRLVVTSRHSLEELDQTLDILRALGQKYGILHKSAAEICAVGRALLEPDEPSECTAAE